MSDLAQAVTQPNWICRVGSPEENVKPSGRKWRLVPMLDRLIKGANQLSVWEISYKPYWIMCDIATVLVLAYAFVFSSHFPSTSAAGLIAATTGALLIYKLARELKTAFGKASARSFLQDCLLVVIPSFLVVGLLFEQPVHLMLAFLGTLIPLYGCFARIGCFLGGCCYGRRSDIGVLYPAGVFESSTNGWRRYSPSPNPNGRVFPIQLVEAVAQAILFVVLSVLIWTRPSLAGYVFWLYLLSYAVVRFQLDFFRTTSARPRRGPFSEAQCVCIAVFAVGLACLLITA